MAGVRKYEVVVCANCGAAVKPQFNEVGYMEAGDITLHCTRNGGGCTPVGIDDLRSDDQLATVTAIDQRDVEPLVQAARKAAGFLDVQRIGISISAELETALAPFTEGEDSP